MVWVGGMVWVVWVGGWCDVAETRETRTLGIHPFQHVQSQCTSINPISTQTTASTTTIITTGKKKDTQRDAKGQEDRHAEIVKEEERLQDRLTEDMALLARSLKENANLAGRIVKGDNEVGEGGR